MINVQFIGNYYFFRYKSTILDMYKIVNAYYSKQPENMESVFEYATRNEGLNCVIINEDTMVIKYISANGNEHAGDVIHRNFIDIIDDNINKINNKYYYEIVDNPNLISGTEKLMPPNSPKSGKNMLLPRYDQENDLNSYPFLNEKSNSSNMHDQVDIPDLIENIIFIKRLDAGNILMIRKPLRELMYSAKIANELYIIVGFVMLFLGSLASFIFSQKITKPIIDMSHIAKNISNLKFDKKYDVKTNDEIGELGKSINLISDELDKSIQELTVANEMLKEDVKRKQQIDDMRKTFISSVSHELKTPIGIIKGYAEGLMLNVVDSEEKRTKYSEIIVDESDKMGKMVGQLLDISYMESEIFQLEKSIFNIAVLVDEIVGKYKHIMNQKGIELFVDNDRDYFVKADYIRIEQVLKNYIANAINHVDSKKKIQIRIENADQNMRVFVANTGKKLSDEDTKKIWDSFYKSDKARSRQYGGTGLGLYIVRSIIEKHKGSYGVTNKEDGVEFWFELPNCPLC